MRKRFWLVVLTLFALTGVLSPLPARAFDPGLSSEQPMAKKTLAITDAKGQRHLFQVEVATSPSDQERGLMFRTQIPENTGMLFAFPDQEEREFWMKNTLVPLDMLFIGANGVIVHIHANARPNDLTPVPSEGPARAVLELAGGTAAKLGISAGDKVSEQPTFRTKLR